jgi:hypothetical protein
MVTAIIAYQRAIYTEGYIMRMTEFFLNREYSNGSNTKHDRPYMVQARQRSQQLTGKR